MGNSGVMDLLKNFVIHAKKQKIVNLLVIALDAEVADAMAVEGIPCHRPDWANQVSGGELNWGSDGFFALNRLKIHTLMGVAQRGFNVIFVDVDTVWLQNPFSKDSDFLDHKGTDVSVSSDCLQDKTGNDGSPNCFPVPGQDGKGVDICLAFNVGVMYWRFTNAALAFLETWRNAVGNGGWEQGIFNDLAMEGNPAPDIPNDQILGWGGRVQLRVFPQHVAANGHSFFVQRFGKVTPSFSPYIVHTTHQFCQKPGKAHRMREAQLFLVDDDTYYSGKFIKFNIKWPDGMP